jgi:hypothetical protein
MNIDQKSDEEVWWQVKLRFHGGGTVKSRKDDEGRGAVVLGDYFPFCDFRGFRGSHRLKPPNTQRGIIHCASGPDIAIINILFRSPGSLIVRKL